MFTRAPSRNIWELIASIDGVSQSKTKVFAFLTQFWSCFFSFAFSVMYVCVREILPLFGLFIILERAKINRSRAVPAVVGENHVLRLACNNDTVNRGFTRMFCVL